MESFDLIIVGTGSGNTIPLELTERRIAIVERDVFGGTCVNRGCIPSKMFVYAADRAYAARDNSRFGLTTSVESVDWPAIVRRVFARIDPIAESGERYREESETITLIRGTGRFVDHKVLEVDGRRITAETILLAAGTRPYVPPIPGLDSIEFHTSDTVMRIPELPARLVIVGGGYIAAEFGHVFDALGSHVSIVNRGGRLLRSEDDDISIRFTELADKRYDLHLDSRVVGVGPNSDGSIAVTVSREGQQQTLDTDGVLIATGRVTNADLLDLHTTGVEVDHTDRVIVGADMQTSVPGIYALGDLVNRHQLKHLANEEARVVFYNLLHPDEPRHMNYDVVPHAVFSYPQVASAGMTERQVAADAVPFITATKPYSSTAYGWAMEDTTSFVKLIAHAQTRQLLGAHIIGEQASTLIQVLVQAMRFNQTVDEIATGQMWIHPALTEVIENALLDL